MVTAILPSMTGGGEQSSFGRRRRSSPSGVSPEFRNSITPSVDSEVTIIPERYTPTGDGVGISRSRSRGEGQDSRKGSSPPRLAGLVGVFTGCGALVALAIFLPLPARFSHIKDITQGQAVADSFYVVGAISLLVAGFCFVGLRNLAGEEHKGWNTLVNSRSDYVAVGQDHGEEQAFLPYYRLLLDSSLLAFRDAQIGLGYLGGFVARASSVGISLFIPLYINAYFIRNGFCRGSPTDPSPELKKECRAAYILSAELTGISQLIALLCAPLFGYLSDRYRTWNVPLLVASVAGIIGYIGFARLGSPEVRNIDDRGGSPAVFGIVALIGISQIGAIVCSLGLLGRGVLGAEGGYNLSRNLHNESSGRAEQAPLLGRGQSRAHLKGSIAGVYSLSGGAAILLLTKLGGFLFDRSTGAPFYMMAAFNAVLLLTAVAVSLVGEVGRRRGKESSG